MHDRIKRSLIIIGLLVLNSCNNPNGTAGGSVGFCLSNNSSDNVDYQITNVEVKATGMYETVCGVIYKECDSSGSCNTVDICDTSQSSCYTVESSTNCINIYGQWVDSAVYLKRGDKVVISSIDGTILTSAAYGLNDTSSAQSSSVDYSSMSSEELESYLAQVDLYSRQATNSLSTSDYQNNGKGIKHYVEADGSVHDIFNAAKGSVVTLQVEGCANDNTSHWTWSEGWKKKKKECNSLGTQCSTSTYWSSPWSTDCTYLCSSPQTTDCWSNSWDKKYLCGTTHSCWQTDGYGLDVIYGTIMENNVGSSWTHTMTVTEDIKLQISDPANASSSSLDFATIVSYRDLYSTTEQYISSLNSNQVVVINNLASDIGDGKYSGSYSSSFISGSNTTSSSSYTTVVEYQTAYNNAVSTFENYIASYSNLDSSTKSDGTTVSSAQDAQDLLDNMLNSYEMVQLSSGELLTEIQEKLFSSGNDSLTGGYTVYAKSTPITYTGSDSPNMLYGCISSSDPNDGGSCSSFKVDVGDEITSPIDGTLYFKIFDTDEEYSGNSGTYTIEVKQEVTPYVFSHIIQSIIDIIANTMTNGGKRIFKALTCDGIDKTSQCMNYLISIRVVLSLYIAIYGIMFLYGIVQISNTDIMMRICKIGLISVLLGEGSFKFFNYYLFEGLIGSSSVIISKATGNLTHDLNPFGFLDKSMGIVMLDPSNVLKLLSICFAGALGPIFLALIIYGTYVLIKSVFTLVKSYLTSYVFIGLLMAIAPVFIPFMLFKTTENLAKNWFGLIIRYTVEPVILIVGAFIITGMMMSYIEAIFNHSICFKCAIPIQLSFPGLEWSSDTLYCIPGFLPWGYDNYGDGLNFTGFISIGTIFGYLILVKLLDSYVHEFGSTLASYITRSFSYSPSLTQAVGRDNLYARGSGLHGSSGSMLERLTGTDAASTNRRAIKTDIKESTMNTAARKEITTSFGPKQEKQLDAINKSMINTNYNESLNKANEYLNDLKNKK
jgi:type IV secretory pathway VirB6-like protein